MTTVQDVPDRDSQGCPGGQRMHQSDQVRAEIGRLVTGVLALQDKDGGWRGQAAGTGCAEIEDLLTREFLGTATAGPSAATAASIRSAQRPDGSWAGCLAPGCSALDGAGSDGSSALSATVRAYLALRLAGDSPDAYHMALAAGWIRDAGGVAAAPPAARLWLALFGITGWEDLGVPVPAAIYAPTGCWPGTDRWARLPQPAVAALAVIGALRPLRQLAFGLPELQVPATAAGRHRDAGRGSRIAADKLAQRVLAGLRAAAKPALAARPAAHAAALRRCGECVAAGQSGSAWSIIALHLLGYPAEHPALALGLSPATHCDGQGVAGVAGMAARQTAQAVAALAEAGLPNDHPALASAATWLLTRRVPGPARWAGGRQDTEPVGWSFDGSGRANASDTAAVLLALCGLSQPAVEVAGAGDHAGEVRRGVGQAASLLARMQRGDGGWSRAARRAGMAGAIGPASAAVTAAAVRALAAAGPPGCRATRRGVAWLLMSQRADGSWPGSEGNALVTGLALAALIEAGVLPGKPAVSRAVGWLTSCQNPDGGWAEHRGAASTLPATARALSALLTAAGGEVTHSAARAACWLRQAAMAGGVAGRSPAAATCQPGDGDLTALLTRLGALGVCTRCDQRPANPAGDGLVPGG